MAGIMVQDDYDIAKVRSRWRLTERGRAIRNLRKKLGWSQFDLARAAKVGRSVVAHLEAAAQEPSAESELQLVNALIAELAARRRSEGEECEVETIYPALVRLSDLARSSVNTRSLHPLEIESLRAFVSLGRKLDSLTRNEALDFAERFIDLGKKLAEAGLASKARACADESASLIEWAKRDFAAETKRRKKSRTPARFAAR